VGLVAGSSPAGQAPAVSAVRLPPRFGVSVELVEPAPDDDPPQFAELPLALPPPELHAASGIISSGATRTANPSFVRVPT
jgi:hypothetical protein